MTQHMVSQAGRRFAPALTLGLALALLSCESVLRVTDPDIIPTASSASGATALRNGVLVRFLSATTGGESTFFFGGLLADEWRSGDTFEQRNTTDNRVVAVTNSFLGTQYRTLLRVLNEGEAAIIALRAFLPTGAANIGQMFAVRAFAANLIGESYCNGVVFSRLDGANIIYGNPVPVDSAFRLATYQADSALAVIGTSSARFTNLAAVVKGRALLNRGQFAAAATAVAAVPTSFTYATTTSANVGENQLWALNSNQRRYVVGDNEGGNGLPFRSASDARLTTTISPPKAFDSSTDFIGQTIWGRFDSTVVASGIEARLIEAEAALQANDLATFLGKLNTARATKTGLAPLTDPGTAAARVDLLFRERAFWMFGTGHRLGDLRRLIRQYNRPAESVFPTGPWFKGGSYGTDVNLPMSFQELNNPNIPSNAQTQTGSTCINRNA
ncbi:MAG: hypothetical protein ACRENB_13810 [Gemmatimonadales bacterium]